MSAALSAKLLFQDVDGTSIAASELGHLAATGTVLAHNYTVVAPDKSILETQCITGGTSSAASTSGHLLVDRALMWLAEGAHAAKALEPRPLPAGFKLVVCGIDAETDPKGCTSTLQLCIGSRVLIVHSSSGGFKSAALRRALNEAVIECPDASVVSAGAGSTYAPLTRVALLFTGAELAKDALDMFADPLLKGVSLHHAVDFTPLLGRELSGAVSSMYLGSKQKKKLQGPVSEGVTRPRADEATDADLIALQGEPDEAKQAQQQLLTGSATTKLGLKALLNTVLDLEYPWVKDKAVTCSDWSRLPLSPAQIKYCALDAWASRVVGEYAAGTTAKGGCSRAFYIDLWPEDILGLPRDDFSPVRHASFGRVPIAPFSLRPLSKHPSAPLKVITKLAKETEGLKQAQKREHAVPISSVERPENRAPRTHVAVVMGAYDKRLRRDSPAEFYCYSRPLARGAAAIHLPPLLWRVDGEVVEVRGKAAIVRINADSGRAGDGTGKVIDGEDIISAFTINPACMQVRTNNFGENDLPLGRAANTINAFVRSTSAYESGDAELMERLVTISSSRIAWRLFLGLPLPLFPSVAAYPSIADAYDYIRSKHAKQFSVLNASQGKAFLNAHTRPVSVIRGPPGTGKTRTVAAITESFVDEGKRVMLIAPANAGTKRLLAAVKDHGYQDVALFLSTEFFASWSELAYAGALPQVVNEALLDENKLQQVDGAREREARRDPKRAEALGLLSRIDIERTRELSLWIDTKTKTIRRVPSVVIMTFGGAAVAESKLSNWHSGPVTQLTKWSDIDVVVLDEASQLWEGHAATLTNMFPSATRLVIVGDDKQLPPFGSGEGNAGKGARSLFECAAKQPEGSVPLTQLNTSYRLPLEIGALLSESLYGGDLKMQRNPLRDQVIRAHLIPRLVGPGVLVRSPLVGKLVKHWPLYWAHTTDATAYQTDTKSWASPVEATAVAEAAVDILGAINDGWRHPSGKAQLLRLQAALGLAPPVRPSAGAGAMADLDAEESNATFHDAFKEPTLVIISPYEAQLQEIQQKLASEMVRRGRMGSVDAALEEIRSRKLVTNIDGYQGQEADFTLITFVRQRGAGFVEDDRRANVMLSRTLQGSLLIGNLHAMEAADRGSSQPYLVSEFARYCLQSDRTDARGTSRYLIPVVRNMAAFSAVPRANGRAVWRNEEERDRLFPSLSPAANAPPPIVPAPSPSGASSRRWAHAAAKPAVEAKVPIPAPVLPSHRAVSSAEQAEAGALYVGQLKGAIAIAIRKGHGLPTTGYADAIEVGKLLKTRQLPALFTGKHIRECLVHPNVKGSVDTTLELVAGKEKLLVRMRAAMDSGSAMYGGKKGPVTWSPSSEAAEKQREAALFVDLLRSAAKAIIASGKQCLDGGWVHGGALWSAVKGSAALPERFRGGQLSSQLEERGVEEHVEVMDLGMGLKFVRISSQAVPLPEAVAVTTPISVAPPAPVAVLSGGSAAPAVETFLKLVQRATTKAEALEGGWFEGDGIWAQLVSASLPRGFEGRDLDGSLEMRGVSDHIETKAPGGLLLLRFKSASPYARPSVTAAAAAIPAAGWERSRKGQPGTSSVCSGAKASPVLRIPAATNRFAAGRYLLVDADDRRETEAPVPPGVPAPVAVIQAPTPAAPVATPTRESFQTLAVAAIKKAAKAAHGRADPSLWVVLGALGSLLPEVVRPHSKLYDCFAADDHFELRNGPAGPWEVRVRP